MHHDFQVTNLLESRGRARNDVLEEEVFYVVNHVSIGNAAWYHHGVFMADGLDSVGSGLKKIKIAILAELGGAAADVTPIFIRNLLVHDPKQITDESRSDIQSEYESLLTSGIKDGYVVFGLVGDTQSMLMKTSAVDAMMATSSVSDFVASEVQKPFLLLEVFLADPIIESLKLQFDKTASDIKALLGPERIAVH